jgi:hypothetical protein
VRERKVKEQEPVNIPHYIPAHPRFDHLRDVIKTAQRLKREEAVRLMRKATI